MRKMQAWFAVVVLTVAALLMGAGAAPAPPAGVGPKPSVDVTVSLNAAPAPDELFYTQMLTCQADDLQLSRQCGFDGPACDKFLTLAVPEPSEACTWRLQGQPTVWGGECKDSRCHFTYFLPQRFRLAAYLPSSDQIFISNPVTRVALYSTYRLELAEGGAARLSEDTPLLRRAYVNGPLIALLLSLVIELIVGYLFVRLTHSPRRALWGVLIGNLLTTPLLWILIETTFRYDVFLIVLAAAEVVIVVVEGLIIARASQGQMLRARAFKMSLLLNLISFIVGTPILASLAYMGIV